MLHRIFLVLLVTIVACQTPENSNPTQLKDMPTALIAKADARFFIGRWEHFVPYEEDAKYDMIWLDFSLDSKEDLIVAKLKRLRASGEILSTVLNHEETLTWINSALKIINDDTLQWTLHVFEFSRITPRVPSLTQQDIRIRDLRNELKRVIHNLITAMGGLDEISLHKIEATLISWEGTSLTQDQLIKIEMLENYLTYAPLAESILRDDLTGLEREIFIAKTKRIFEQLTEVIETGARCGLSMTDIGDFHAMVFGKDLCTSEEINIIGRAISAIAIVGGKSEVFRKFAEGVGISSKAVIKEITEAGEKIRVSANKYGFGAADKIKGFAKSLRKSPDRNFSHVLYPRGPGASSLPVPNGHTKVSRWMSDAEVKAWYNGGGTRIPTNIGANARLYVTKAGAPKPGGTGNVRVDFHVPDNMLQRAGNEQWHQIIQPEANTPIYNVEIFLP